MDNPLYVPTYLAFFIHLNFPKSPCFLLVLCPTPPPPISCFFQDIFIIFGFSPVWSWHVYAWFTWNLLLPVLTLHLQFSQILENFNHFSSNTVVFQFQDTLRLAPIAHLLELWSPSFWSLFFSAFFFLLVSLKVHNLRILKSLMFLFSILLLSPSIIFLNPNCSFHSRIVFIFSHEISFHLFYMYSFLLQRAWL